MADTGAATLLRIHAPRAPRSSARASQVYSPPGTRTMGLIGRLRQGHAEGNGALHQWC